MSYRWLIALSLLACAAAAGCTRPRPDAAAGAAHRERTRPPSDNGCAAGDLSACTRQALLELRHVGPLNFHGFSLLEHACERGEGAACLAAAELESAAFPQRELHLRFERACRLGQARGCIAFAAEHLGTRRPDELTAAAFFAHACKLGHAAGCSEASRLLARWPGVHALELLPLGLFWRGAESHHSQLQTWVLEGRAAIIGDARGLGLIDARTGALVGPIIAGNGRDVSIRELPGLGILMWARTGHGTLDTWLTARSDGRADERRTLELPGLDVCEVLGLSRDGRRIAVRLQPRDSAVACRKGTDPGRVQGFRLPDWQPDADTAGLPTFAGEHDLVKAGVVDPEIAAGTVSSLLLASDGKSALAWSEAGGLLRLWFEQPPESAGASQLAVPEWWSRLQPMPPRAAAAEPRPVEPRPAPQAVRRAVDSQPAAFLLGRVLDAAGSSTRARLGLARADIDAPASTVQADGAFRFAGLEPGRPYRLTGLGADGAFASAHVTLQPGENRLDLQLLSPASPNLLRLRARTAGGRPLRDAIVLGDGLGQRSDQEGLIVTDRAPPGPVSVRHPGWPQTVVVARDPGKLLEAVFPDARITIRQRPGGARGEREIALVAEADPARLRPASDTLQSRFERLSPGRYEVHVVRAAEGLFGSAVVELRGGDDLVIDEPPLRRGVAFDGVVLESATSAPLIGAVVSTPCVMLDGALARAHRMGAGTCRATTDAAGRFRLIVAPGRRYLTIERAGFGTTAREVEVPLPAGARPPRFSVTCGDALVELAYVLQTRAERDGLRVVSVPSGFDALAADDLIDRIDGDEAVSPGRLFDALHSAAVTVLRVRRPVAASSQVELLWLSRRHRVLGRTREAWTLEVVLRRPQPVCDQRWLTRALEARGHGDRGVR